MTTANRYELRDLARELVAAERVAAGVARRFRTAMRGETRCAPSSADLPSIDPEIVEALAALQVHAEHVRGVLSDQASSVLVIVLSSPRRVDLARRIADAGRAGEEEARRDDLGEDTKRAVDAAVRASTERARGGA